MENFKIIKIFENPEKIIYFSYHMIQNIKKPTLTNSAYVCSCESPSQSNRGGNTYKGITTTTINPVKIPTDNSKLEIFSNFFPYRLLFGLFRMQLKIFKCIQKYWH